MTKAYPYPEIVTGEAWQVYGTTDINQTPRTDNLNKKMVVPLDRECEYCGVNHSRMIRRHQLGSVINNTMPFYRKYFQSFWMYCIHVNFNWEPIFKC